MLIYTSYFYNIRFFKPHQIPVSTAVWDPKWFHEGLGQDHIWKDKNGVWNGIRAGELNPESCHSSGCPCLEKNYETCKFLKEYREGLRKLDFEQLLKDLTKLGEVIKEQEGFEEEPEIILIVHEATNNPCSERVPLQELFKEHDIEVLEWKSV